MIKILKELGLTKFFLLAILIRILIMPFFFHPDIKTYYFQSSFLQKGIWNIYPYLVDNKGKLPLKEEFVYFPLTYIFLGSYEIMAKPFLGPEFSTWLSDASQESVNRVGVFRYLFILKFPYLLLDLTVAFLLIRFFSNPEEKKKAFILWLFNPISLVIIYFYSNLDITPATLILSSILMLRSKKVILSGVLLGAAVSFKAYPLIFLPLLLIYLNNYKERLKFVSSLVIFLIVTILPFFSKAFVNSALISGLTTRIAFPSIPIGFGEALMVGVVPLAIFFIKLLVDGYLDKVNLFKYCFWILLLMFSTIHFHIQWLMWIIPFLILFSVTEKRLSKFAWFWISLAILIPFLYDDRSMTISLLSTLSLLYNLLPTPFLIMSSIYDTYLMQSILHSLIFSISVVLVWIGFSTSKK